MKECPACRRCYPDEINHCPQDGDATIPSLLGETVLDARYQLERRLGQGGMGVVFQARHIFLKTQHAIKVILPDLVGNDPMLVTRFRQEALAAAAIRHQNIIAVTDFGVVRGTMPFLVMEFVKGKSLQEIMTEEGAMPPARAFELICPTAAGIAAAHRQNIVHRDLKPLNIMVQDGTPIKEGLKILDFGLAKIKSGELLGSFVQAKTSGLMGSPFYMAPEQWSDEEPDLRADIYSIGIILYQMLAGDVPFKGSSIPSIMKKHLTLPPPSLSSMGVHVPSQIEAVVRHALEKDLSARTPSVEMFLNELKEALRLASVGLRTTFDTQPVDLNRTVVSPASGSATGSMTHRTGFETNFDPTAGVISSHALGEEVRERAEKERIEREELTRKAEAQRRAEEETARKKTEEAERLRKQLEERESKERLDRVARQAEELEQKLARLTHSIPEQTTAVVDTDPGNMRTIGAQVAGDNSFPGAFPRGMLSQGLSAYEAKPKKSPALLVGIIFLVLLLGAGSIVGYILWPRPPVVVKDPGKNGPTAPVTFKPEFAEIPGGTFQMGRDDGPKPQERPAHTVTVGSFAMDKTEVTNAEYADFVRETRYAPPANWPNGKPAFGQELWPVVNVSVEDAKAFAAWRSKRDKVTYRLPTEQEWEYAARNGAEDSLYPWGNTWLDGRAVVKEGFPKAVGSAPEGKTKSGIEDMIGNVWEWTSTEFTMYPGNTEAEFPPQYKGWVVKRGGSFLSDPNDKDNPITATYRDFAPASLKHPTIGFRLVRSVQ
jgi:formylglycine-generating enzyme required for sulfatase activity/serine/threonine protein kinase